MSLGDGKDFKLSPLDVFDNPETGRLYTIEFVCPEWTAVCPKSGFPDFGCITITYEPKQLCLELKALKLYINSFRDAPIFHEGATNRILTDLVKACDPWSMKVLGDFNVRGNIKTRVTAQFVHQDKAQKAPGFSS